MASRPWTVAVLYGGISAERAVSIDSGRAVAAALGGAGLQVIEVDVSGDIESTLDALKGRCDVAFIALHGTFGEDGGVQRLLEARGIPYTGSGTFASRAAMDKQLSKAMFVESGVPTPVGIALSQPFSTRAVARLVDSMGYPVVIKPVAQGSSKGVSIVESAAEIPAAIAASSLLDDRVLLEAFLPGAELTVGILNEAPLPVVEVRYAGQAFDYHAKYESDQTEYLVDPPLGAALKRQLQQCAVRAHAALGCRCFSRVDFRLDSAGEPMVLEVNTIPGLTAHSLLPKAAAHAGIAFPDLCKRMLASGFVPFTAAAPRAVEAPIEPRR